MYTMCIRKSNASGRMMLTNSSNYQLPCGWPLVDLAEVFALSTWNNPEEEKWGSVGCHKPPPPCNWGSLTLCLTSFRWTLTHQWILMIHFFGLEWVYLKMELYIYTHILSCYIPEHGSQFLMRKIMINHWTFCFFRRHFRRNLDSTLQ